MSTLLFVVLGAIRMLMGIIGVLTGKVMAGSRGLKSNYYNRYDNPLLFYVFVITYISFGAFVIIKAL